jgi:hypothetical protein
MQMKTGHVMRVVGLDDPDALRAKGVSRPTQLSGVVRQGSASQRTRPLGCP